MDSSPPTLYKYFGPDRVAVVAHGLVRYSPMGAFNDPFEGRPEITSLTMEAGALTSLEAALSVEANTSYDALPAEIRAAMSYALWEKLITQQINVKKPELLAALHGMTPLVRDLLARKFDELLGAFCLSEVPDSLLMWSHYAASHAGFVLAFDARHPHFHEERSSEDEFRHLRRVIYREARPSAALTDFEGVDVFLVKSGHWAYEREWRIFRALSEAAVVYPGTPHPAHLFRFPPSALQAVILGARSSAETAAAVIDAIRANAELSRVKIKRARPDASHFLLRIVDDAI